MKIHFIGIGGASLSKLALIYKSMGHEVSGSDRTKSETTSELQNLGIDVFFTHKKENVINKDAIIFSDAIDNNNPEIIEAKLKHIPLISRKEALNLISSLYTNIIAVCGSHGKTTTTALISSCFKPINPQTHIGGEINGIGLNEKYYKQVKLANIHKNVFITEACEFKKNLLSINPSHIVLLNVDADHLDCYKDIDEIEHTFLEFAQKLEDVKNSVLFCNIDDKRVQNISKLVKCNVITFGLNSNAEYTAKNIVLHDDGIKFDLYHFNTKIKTISSKLFGRHNIYNLLASCVVCEHFKTTYSKLNNYSNYIKKFSGVKRRFEFYGKLNSNVVIHDYAHHPTEILASIKTVKEHFKNNVIVIFEPHTYTRTRGLWNEFRDTLSQADLTYVLKIYSAREKPIKGITSSNLVKGLKNVIYVKNYEDCIEKLKEIKNSTILILGAGSIENLAISLKNKT